MRPAPATMLIAMRMLQAGNKGAPARWMHPCNLHPEQTGGACKRGFLCVLGRDPGCTRSENGTTAALAHPARMNLTTLRLQSKCRKNCVLARDNGCTEVGGVKKPATAATAHLEVFTDHAADDAAVLPNACAEDQCIHPAAQRCTVSSDVLAHAVHKHVQRKPRTCIPCLLQDHRKRSMRCIDNHSAKCAHLTLTGCCVGAAGKLDWLCHPLNLEVMT